MKNKDSFLDILLHKLHIKRFNTFDSTILIFKKIGKREKYDS